MAKKSKSRRPQNLILILTLVAMLAASVIITNCTSSRHASEKNGADVSAALPQSVGLPKIDPADQVVRHSAITLCYSEPHEQARWVAYMLTRERAAGQFPRSDNFRPDEQVATGSAQLADYRGSGYSRGHLCPAQDMKWDRDAMDETFLLSNMSPQKQDFNDGIWKKIENRVHSWASLYDTLYVVTGPVLRDGLPTIGESRVSVPEYFYKVVYAPHPGQMIGWVVRHENLKTTAPRLAVTVDSVERLTGIDFFSALPDELESRLESAYSRDDWNWK